MLTRGRTMRVSALVVAALLAGCGGGLAVVGGDAGEALTLRDVAIDASEARDAGMDAATDTPDVGSGEDRVRTEDRGALDVIDAGGLLDAVDVVDAPTTADLAEPQDTDPARDGPDADDIGPVDAGGINLCLGRCAPGEACCDARCVDLTLDPLHCGACDRRCEASQNCVQGRCVPSCPAGQARCGLDCVDLQRSRLHCGACDNVCPQGFACAGGVCSQVCPAGTRNCNGACVDPNTDEGNCGDCGTRCGPDVTCFQGRCRTECGPTAPTFCPGPNYCANIRTDASDCGRCGNACPIGMRCAAGTCACQPDQILCGGACVSSTCTRGVGACRRGGSTRCVSGAPQCDAVAGSPGVEVCNNVDDNCDGAVDEMLTRPCYTGTGAPGVGVCRAGTQSCAVGAWGACVGEVGPQAETCDGRDNDCNGMADDLPSQACFTGSSLNRGRGLCRDGQLQCIGGAPRCVGEVLPLPEVCNNQDDDCDGMVDESATPSSCPSLPNAVVDGCLSGRCHYSCAAGFSDCDGNLQSNGCEVNLRSDPSHCGTCTNACPFANVCDSGACRLLCSGQRCDGQCVDTTTDSAHCGACGNRCVAPAGGSAACMAGMCVGGCPAGTTLCGGVCVDLTRDPGNCGACGVACGPGRRCQNDTGAPTCACASGTIDCGGACVSPLSDVHNCGGCGVRCGAGQSCEQGACRCNTTGASLCNGACVPLGASCSAGVGACRRIGSVVCGTMGPTCDAVAGTPTTERCDNVDNDCDGVADNNNAELSCTPLPFQSASCTSGGCVTQCFSGRGDCDGVISNGCETDLFDNPQQCGGCGRDCGNGQCISGSCVACEPGFTRCGNACVNLRTDPANCGSCGTRCGLGEFCEAGACQSDSTIRTDGGTRLDGGQHD